MHFLLHIHKKKTISSPHPKRSSIQPTLQDSIFQQSALAIFKSSEDYYVWYRTKSNLSLLSHLLGFNRGFTVSE